MTEQAMDTNPVAAAETENKESWGSFLWFCVKLIVAVLLFRTLAFSFFTIPSESMLPDLETGDYLIAAKWPYGYNESSMPLGLPGPSDRIFGSTPERGDVAVFKHPVDGADYVKRVIGLPGDTVAMVDGQLILNGELVEKKRVADFTIPITPNTRCHFRAEVITGPDGTPLCRYQRFEETLPGGKRYRVLDFGPTPQDDFGPVVVPDGKLFMMGDNRDNSLDSRFPAQAEGGVGIIDQRLLVARASVVLFSSDGSASWFKPWTWFTATRWDRVGHSI